MAPTNAGLQKYQGWAMALPIVIGAIGVLFYCFSFYATFQSHDDLYNHRRELCDLIGSMNDATPQQHAVCEFAIAQNSNQATCEAVDTIPDDSNFGGCKWDGDGATAAEKCTAKHQKNVLEQYLAFESTFGHDVGLDSNQWVSDDAVDCKDYVKSVDAYYQVYLIMTIVFTMFYYLHSILYSVVRNENNPFIQSKTLRIFVETFALLLPLAYVNIADEVWKKESGNVGVMHPGVWMFVGWFFTTIYMALLGKDDDNDNGGSLFAKDVGANPNGKGAKPRNQVKSIHW